MAKAAAQASASPLIERRDVCLARLFDRLCVARFHAHDVLLVLLKPHDAGKYITVYERRPDDSWAMARDIWNSNNPLPGMPE